MDARTLVPLLAEERPRFVRLVQRRLPTAADAEDVVQRAMIQAAARAGSLTDPARVRPWFGRILRHAIADFYRSRRPESPSDPDALEAAATASSVVPRAGTPCPCTLRLLAALRPAYADVLRRIDVEDESPAAAAGALAISESNLYVRLHRARRALRERTEAHCGVSSHGPCLDCSCDANHRCGGDASTP